MKAVPLLVGLLLATACVAQVPDYIHTDLNVAEVKEIKLNSVITKVEAYNSQRTLLLEAYFKNEEPVGVWKKYRPNGKLYYTEGFKNGTVHGWVQYYDESGILHYRCKYRNGERNGPYEEFYSSGKVKCKSRYRPAPFLRYEFIVPRPGDYPLDSLPGPASVKVGKEICYYESGQVMAVKYYDNYHIRQFDVATYQAKDGSTATYFRTTETEVKTGRWYFYDATGKIIRVEEYDKGNLVKNDKPEMRK